MQSIDGSETMEDSVVDSNFRTGIITDGNVTSGRGRDVSTSADLDADDDVDPEDAAILNDDILFEEYLTISACESYLLKAAAVAHTLTRSDCQDILADMFSKYVVDIPSEWSRCAAICNRNKGSFVNTFNAKFKFLSSMIPSAAETVSGEEFRKMFYKFKLRFNGLMFSYCNHWERWPSDERDHLVHQECFQSGAGITVVTANRF
jgi:hypothetical protein